MLAVVFESPEGSATMTLQISLPSFASGSYHESWALWSSLRFPAISRRLCLLGGGLPESQTVSPATSIAEGPWASRRRSFCPKIREPQFKLMAADGHSRSGLRRIPLCTNFLLWRCLPGREWLDAWRSCGRSLVRRLARPLVTGHLPHRNRVSGHASRQALAHACLTRHGLAQPRWRSRVEETWTPGRVI